MHRTQESAVLTITVLFQRTQLRTIQIKRLGCGLRRSQIWCFLVSPHRIRAYCVLPSWQISVFINQETTMRFSVQSFYFGFIKEMRACEVTSVMSDSLQPYGL